MTRFVLGWLVVALVAAGCTRREAPRAEPTASSPSVPFAVASPGASAADRTAPFVQASTPDCAELSAAHGRDNCRALLVVHPGRPRYVLDVVRTGAGYDRLEVRREGDNTLVQVFDISVSTRVADFRCPVDVNQDGYQDLCVTVERVAGHRVTRAYPFDAVAGRFGRPGDDGLQAAEAGGGPPGPKLATVFIHASLPPYTIRISPDPAGKPGLMQVAVTRGTEPRPVQTFDLDASEAHITDPRDTALDFEDLNFDGYLDLAILTVESTPTANQFWDSWLFDPATGRFLFSKELAGLGVVSANPETREVVSGSRASAHTWKNTFYRWEKGRPVKVRTETTSADDNGESVTEWYRLGTDEVVRRVAETPQLGPDSAVIATEVVVEELRGGQLVVVERSTRPPAAPASGK